MDIYFFIIHERINMNYILLDSWVTFPRCFPPPNPPSVFPFLKTNKQKPKPNNKQGKKQKKKSINQKGVIKIREI